MSSRSKIHLSFQKALFLLLLVVLVPVVIFQGYLLYVRFQTGKAEELEANLEMARAVRVAFDLFIRDVLHQELSIGISATANPPLSMPDLTDLLRRSAAGHEFVRSYFLTDPKGRILASSSPEHIGISLSDREYFKNIQSGKEWALSNLILAKVNGEPIITISRSIRDVKGNLLGSVVASVAPDALAGVLAVDRAKDAGVSLLDRNGMHVARYPYTKYTLDQKNWLKWYPQQVERALKGEEITASVESNRTGEKRLVGFVPVHSVGWVAAASRSEDRVLSGIVYRVITQGVLFLLLTLFVFGIALVLSRRISKSIMRLRDHALALGRGEPHSTESQVMSEMEELAIAFDDMALKVQARETALRANEERFRSILENMSEGLMLFDADGNLIYQNPASLRIHGFGTQEDGRIENEDLPSTWKAWDDKGRLLSFEEWPVSRVFRHERFRDQVLHVIRVETGQEFFGSYNGSPIYDSEGKLTLGFITIREITEQVQAQAELADRERRLRAFFDSGTLGTLFWNMDGQIIDANDKFLQMLGYSREDLFTGRISWSQMTPQEYQPLNENAIHELKTTGIATPFEKEYIRKDGTRLPIFIGAAMLDERRYEGVAFILDITERKKAEEALRESEQRYRSLHSELELRVRERTVELERKNQELQEFAFIASHDLSEPLRKIQTFGSLLKAKGSDHLNALEMDYVSRMSGAANRMQELLDALLSYSRIETKGVVFVATRLKDVVREVIGDLELVIRGIEAHVEIGKLPIVAGDPNQLRQLFQNLIANALKYHRSEVRPRVKIFGEEETGTHRVYIEDNGIGFEEKYLDKIFQPFQRLHGRQEYPGAGIGLAICKKIVTRHGGTITARSTPGKGSTFIVILPVNQDKAK